MSDWKPGDVAMVTSRLDRTGEVLSLRIANAWTAADREGRRLTMYDDDERLVRPLVVIDPGDADQVERLRRSLARLEFSGASLADMLREFAAPTPPKPDEPQGLGAVVEDVDGRWVRVKSTTTVRHWFHSSQPVNPQTWADFTPAVRVLSPGVTTTPSRSTT